MRFMKVLFLLNSDFGVKNTIGARAKPIADELIKNHNILKIICRRYNKNLKSKYIIQIFPYSNIMMKLLTAIPIYISKKFPANEVKNNIFEYFAISKLKNRSK